MKLTTLLAIIVALLVAGCGGSREEGSSGESFHEHQVNQVVEKIEFMEGLPKLIMYDVYHGQEARAERLELMGLKTQTHLEVDVSGKLIYEACLRASDAVFCTEKK